jgi:hypothetical protein
MESAPSDTNVRVRFLNRGRMMGKDEVVDPTDDARGLASAIRQTLAAAQLSNSSTWHPCRLVQSWPYTTSLGSKRRKSDLQ